MLAPLKQRLPFETPVEPARTLALPQAPAADRGIALMIGLLGFFAFLPYPALPVGGSTAIQIGNVLTLLLVAPVFAISWAGRPFFIYPLLIAALALSIGKVAVLGGGDLGISFKAMLVWALSSMVLLIPQLYARGYALELLTGIAVAALLHAAVGILQLYSFASDQFPLKWLYVNRSFLSVQDNAQIIAHYVRRPFGIFPEPSAMSSSLAPWVLFWAAEICGLIRLRRTPSPWQRRLWGAAAVGALALIILSQSGHAAVTLAALSLIAILWLVRSRATARTFIIIAAGIGVVLPLILWAAAQALGNRVGGLQMGNSSWAERSHSLWLGFLMLIDGGPLRGLFGMGVGLVSPAIHDAASIDAVFSVVLNFIYETGLIGFIAVACVAQLVIKVWKQTRFSLVFAAFAAVWLIGITITTSYEQLLPLWIALGWLTVWPEICETVPARPPASVPAPPQKQSIEHTMPVMMPEFPKRWTDR